MLNSVKLKDGNKKSFGETTINITKEIQENSKKKQNVLIICVSQSYIAYVKRKVDTEKQIACKRKIGISLFIRFKKKRNKFLYFIQMKKKKKINFF